MKNIIDKPAKVFPLSCLLASCALLGGEKIEGCMYRRGRPVNVRCINDVLANAADNPGSGYPAKSFESCVAREFDASPAAATTLLVDEEGRQSVKAACLYEGKNSHNYYRWEGDGGKLYVKYLSCAAGCISISDAYRVEFPEGGGIKATLLATKKD
jgi:hypothetical protein